MIEVTEPATEQVIAEVPRAGAEGVDEAVGRAKEAHRPGCSSGSATPWRSERRTPERLLGQTIPVAGRVDMSFQEPLAVVGLMVPRTAGRRWRGRLVVPADGACSRVELRWGRPRGTTTQRSRSLLRDRGS